MERFCWMHIVFTLLVCFLHLIDGELVHITVLTVGYTNIENTSPQYQCYRSEDGVTYSFGRSAPITTDVTPPNDEYYSNNIQRVVFPDTSDWDTNGFGPFYCEASKEGRDVTRITTFFQRSDARFIPSDEVFTKTVNVNDTGVTISMAIQESVPNVINWRKDGGDMLDEYEGMNQIIFPDPIQKSDEGIYEIHYYAERTDNRGGLFRLIVRECPAGKWGPPDCYGICDKCYNGGVCDDKSGLCICPNNFRGPNCLDICRSDGGNRFGLDCEFQCTYRGDPANPCHGVLFCLPDPYGCSCDIGAHGYECRTLCSAGTYGPGCTETCHCAQGSSCSIYSGVCSGGCATGWSGDNCQIPDVCEVGYYGDECTYKCHCWNDAPCHKNTGECPQQQCAIGYKVASGQVICRECEGGTFGVDCGQSCHCTADACEKERGLCNGQCIDDWIEAYFCQIRISRLVPVRVNPYLPSSITCYVEGNSLPEETSVSLYRFDGQNLNNTGISKRSSCVTGSERAVVFEVDSVYPQDYVCMLSGIRLSITNATYVLPVIEGEPVILSRTSTTVSFRWNAWSEGNDEGDPPLIGYDVFVKIGSEWKINQRVDHLTTSATVDNLIPDTDYGFRVAAAREGLGGTGTWSPESKSTTLCGHPSASPTEVNVSATTNKKQLEIHWQAVSSESAECRSGVTHYVIYYSSVGSTLPNHVSVNGVESYVLTGLETYMDYTIRITASNKDEESNMSSEIIGKTLEEVPPPPINVNIPRTTSSTITVSWSTPLPPNINGNIQKYIISYQEINTDVEGYTSIEVLSHAFAEEYTILHLPPEKNYVVWVQTINGIGSSSWSKAMNATTIISGVGTRIPVKAVAGGLIGALLVILLLLFAVVFYRRKQSRMEAEPPTSSPIALVGASPQYEIPILEGSKSQPYDYQSLNADDAHIYQAIDVVDQNIKGDHSENTHTYLDPTPDTHTYLDPTPDIHTYLDPTANTHTYFDTTPDTHSYKDSSPDTHTYLDPTADTRTYLDSSPDTRN